MPRVRVKKRAKTASDPEGPGAVAVSKIRSDPDFHAAKKVVPSDAGGYEVIAIESGRGFGEYSSRTRAARRLGLLEKASPMSRDARKKAETPATSANEGDEGSSQKKPETRVSETPAHVHTLRVGGATITTSKNTGDPHTHRATLPDGKVVTLSSAKDAKGHTHRITVDGTAITSSGPRAEAEKKPKKKAETEPEEPKKSSIVPDVLTFDAVVSKRMPEEGSGLPASLEQDVPPRFCFWKCSDPDEARRVRDALVEECLFTEETIKNVSGVPRRVITQVVEKFFVPNYSDDDSPPRVPTDTRAIIRAAAHLPSADVDEDGNTLLLDEDVVKAFGIGSVIEKAQNSDGDFLIAAPDTSENRLAMKSIGGAYRMQTIPGVIFATSTGFTPTPILEVVQPSREDELIEKALESKTRLVKAEEERIVYGVVLEPDEVDKQNDTVSAEEIRSAAHKFMEDFGVLGLQHREAINGQVKLLENFIAPTDFEMEGDKIKKGSWVMAERILSDDLWEKIKKGEITGFSIGGDAVRKPVD